MKYYQSVNEHFKRPFFKNDEFYIFEIKFAVKLRELPKDQTLIAEKITNDTLFQSGRDNLMHPQIQFREHEFILASPISISPTHQPFVKLQHQHPVHQHTSHNSSFVPFYCQKTIKKVPSYNYYSASSVQYNSDSIQSKIL